MSKLLIQLFRPVTALIVTTLSLAGCASTGPEAMKASRLAYNTALQETARNELLLNLVRLRYVDSPEFLEVSAISSQLAFDASASLGGTVGENGGTDSWLALPDFDIGFSNRPTVTFSPQRERDFTRRLLAPVDADTLQALVQYGWGLDRVLRLTVQEMNGLVNPMTRESPSVEDRPMLREFADAASMLGELHVQGKISWTTETKLKPISGALPADRVQPSDLLQAEQSGALLRYDAADDSYHLMQAGKRHVLSVAPDTAQLAAGRELAEQLGLATGGTTYEIVSPRGGISGDREAGDRETLALRTRSVLGAMAYLSQGVRVPKEHLARGIVSESLTPSSPSLGLFEVQVSSKRPGAATLAIPYRNYWFYIDENDLESRRTLGLLDYLLRLNVTAGGTSGAPVLTLPVGR